MKPKILIIEDDYAIIRGLKDSFSHQGYEVTTVMDGESAISTAKQLPFDLILLDIMLPKRNGFEVCESIRAAAIDTPIIMLTAKGEEPDIVRGLNIGADDYITKPFSTKQLHAKCAAFLRRYKQTEAPALAFGDFILNPETRNLTNTLSQKIISLTPKEYALLHLLLRREGQTFTRESILEAVWGDRMLTTFRSVDRCVNTLRKKIETDTKRPKFLHSIRDIGYRFTVQ